MEVQTAAPSAPPISPKQAQTDAAPIGMQVKKRSGALEPVDLNKIVTAVSRSAEGLQGVDPMRVSTRTISGLYDGATTAELDRLSIQTAAALISEEPELNRVGELGM